MQVPKTPAPVQLKKWRRQSVGGEFTVSSAVKISKNEKKNLLFTKFSLFISLENNFGPFTNTNRK